MFSHVLLGTNDLARATKFYDALLVPLGLARSHEQDEPGLPGGTGWAEPGRNAPAFYTHETFDREPATVGNGTMVAFLAPSREAVDLAFRAGLQAGGSDEGAPNDRPHYGDGYYGAYLRDPDGNKVHLVFRGDLPANERGTGSDAT